VRLLVASNAAPLAAHVDIPCNHRRDRPGAPTLCSEPLSPHAFLHVSVVSAL
jgi:hypothetical protein